MVLSDIQDGMKNVSTTETCLLTLLQFPFSLACFPLCIFFAEVSGVDDDLVGSKYQQAENGVPFQVTVSALERID